jgi:hypothetical protein
MAGDDNVTIDLTGYKDKVGNRVAAGTYLVKVEDVEKDTSSNGNPMINLWLLVVGGEFDGATIVDRLTQTPKSLFRTVNFMQAIGLPTPKKRLNVNVRAWVGKVLEITVEDGDPYNGSIKSEVRAYNRATKAAAGKAKARVQDGDGLDEFAATSAAPDMVGTDPADALPVTSEEDVPEEVDLDELNL